MDWFLYDNGLRHERVNNVTIELISISFSYNVLSIDIIFRTLIVLSYIQSGRFLAISCNDMEWLFKIIRHAHENNH